MWLLTFAKSIKIMKWLHKNVTRVAASGLLGLYLGCNLALAATGNNVSIAQVGSATSAPAVVPATKSEQGVTLYDPTSLRQIELDIGSIDAYTADLPVSAVMVSASTRKFLIGKEWYKIGDLVLNQWIVEEITSDHLVFRSRNDNNKIWTIKLNAKDERVIKNYN